MGLLQDCLQFYPALNSTSCVVVPSILIPSARLCWYITLSVEQFEECSILGHSFQVWTNIRDEKTWTELSFTKRSDKYGDQQFCQNVDISFQPPTSLATLKESAGQIVLEATTPLLPILDRNVLYTYRLVDCSGYIHWFGTPSSNGQIQIADTCVQQQGIAKLQWLPSQYDTLVCNTVLNPAKHCSINIENEEICLSWGVSSNGEIHFSENMPDTLELTAVVLLPRRKAAISSLVAFYPILYISQGGLSISRSEEGYKLQFPPKVLHVHAMIETSKWQEEIFARNSKLQVYDVDNTDILVLFQNQPMPCFYFLPIQQFATHVSLRLSKIISLVGNPPFALIEPRSTNWIFLLERTEAIHLEIGLSGGKLVLAMVYTLASQPEWKIMFLPEDGESTVASIHLYDGSSNRVVTAEQEPEVQNSIATQHHNPVVAGVFLFSLALQFLRLLLKLLPSPQEQKTDTKLTSQYSFDETSPELATADSNKTSLVFKASGRHKILLHGQGDVAGVAMSLNGHSLSIIPENLADGRWIYNIPGRYSEDNLDHQHRISISA